MENNAVRHLSPSTYPSRLPSHIPLPLSSLQLTKTQSVVMSKTSSMPTPHSKPKATATWSAQAMTPISAVDQVESRTILGLGLPFRVGISGRGLVLGSISF